MTLTRFALCLAAVSLGCNQTPAAPAPRPAQPATTATPSLPDPDARMRNWVPGAANAPPNAPSHGPAAAPSPGTQFQGSVRETMNAGGYTYLRVAVDGADRWVATMQMPVAVGDQVTVDGGNIMAGFHSPTLNRTFDSIVFSGAVRVGNGQVAPPTAPTAPTAPTPTAPAPADNAPSAGARHGTVRETMSSGGYTYVRVEGGGQSFWAAVPQTTVAVGDEVEVPPGSEMPGFHSSSLNRTFDQITFASELRVLHGGAPSAAPAPSPSHAPAPGALPPGHPPLGNR